MFFFFPTFCFYMFFPCSRHGMSSNFRFVSPRVRFRFKPELFTLPRFEMREHLYSQTLPSLSNSITRYVPSRLQHGPTSLYLSTLSRAIYLNFCLSIYLSSIFHNFCHAKISGCVSEFPFEKTIKWSRHCGRNGNICLL